MKKPAANRPSPELAALEAAVKSAPGVKAQVEAILALSKANCYTDARRALALANEALRISASVDHQPGIAWSHRRRAFILNLTGKFMNAFAAAREALERFKRLGDLRGEIYALCDLGATCFNLGHMRRALAYYQRALALNERLGDPRSTAATRMSLGQVHAQLDENETALGHFAAARDLARSLGEAATEAGCLIHAGIAQRRLGRADAARRSQRGALAIARRLRLERLEMDAVIMLAELDLDARRWAPARAGFERASAFAEAAKMFVYRINANYGLASAALGRGELAEGARIAAGMRALAAEEGSRYGMLLTRICEGRLALAQARRGEARRHARAALALAQELENREFRDLAKKLIGEATGEAPGATPRDSTRRGG